MNKKLWINSHQFLSGVKSMFQKCCGVKLTSTWFNVTPTVMVCGGHEYENLSHFKTGLQPKKTSQLHVSHLTHITYAY